jgi:hypothetical protein
MRSTLIAMLALPAVGLLGSCPDEMSGPRAGLEGDPVVDERSGTVMNVRLGDSAREIRRELGRPAKRETRPVEEVGLPWIVEDPRQERAELPVSLTYADLDVLTTRESGAYTFSIWREGVRTARGVAIGDSLARARERYPELECGVRNRNTEYVEYSYCSGRVGRHTIWFGEDPIESITIATVPLG